MDETQAALDAIARAILDGTSVDWRTVRCDTGADRRSLVDELEVVARLADFHRNHREHSTPAAETWGHIRVLETLGTGAFGRVYRGWDTRLDREVALKLVPASSDAGGTRTSSIIEEGRLLARVRHPNVVTIYGAERFGETVGLWMELIDGETVEQRLAHGPPFQPSEVIEIGIFAADPDVATKNDILHLAAHPLHNGANTITVIVDKQPSFAAIDPYLTRIDRNRFDNVKHLSTSATSAD